MKNPGFGACCVVWLKKVWSNSGLNSGLCALSWSMVSLRHSCLVLPVVIPFLRYALYWNLSLFWIDPLSPLGMYSSSCLMSSFISALFMFSFPPFLEHRCRLIVQLLLGESLLLNRSWGFRVVLC